MPTISPQIRKLLLFFFLITSLSQCKKKTESKTASQEFTKYISAYTSGVISNNGEIRILLAKGLSNEQLNNALDKKLFSFEPSIEGETYWRDNRTLVFKPQEPLESGRQYNGKLQLKNLMDVPQSLKVFPFQFRVAEQTVEVEFYGMDPIDQNDLKWLTIKGNLFTGDRADGELIENITEAFQDRNKLKIRWKHGPEGRNHKFEIDSVLRNNNTGQVSLSWKGKEIGARENGEKTFSIPPLGEFKVMDIRIEQQPEQAIRIFFSDPVSKKQDLNGLIYLESGGKVKLIRESATIKVIPVKPQKGTVTLVITKGVKNIMGYQLIESYKKSFSLTDQKPTLEAINSGVIMPDTKGLIFPFRAVNLKAVNLRIIEVFDNNITQFLQSNQFDGSNDMIRVGRIIYKKEIPLKSDKAVNYDRWNNFSIDLSRFIKVKPGTIYRVLISFDQSQSLFPCTNPSKLKDLRQFEDDEEVSSFDDPSSWYQDFKFNYNNYNYKERNDPCKPTYYMIEKRFIAKNILASNLGIIAKGGTGNELLVAVTDLKTTDPVPGTEIVLYNFQNQLITTQKTDQNGFIHIDLKKKPFLLIAKKNNQTGYLRLDDGSALSLSMFDVGGQKSKKGIKGFLYGERGVWRPGDSIYLSFILEDKNKVLPEKHPVVFELYTPFNQLYKRIVTSKTGSGFYSFKTATAQDDPTGNWKAKVKIGGSVFEKNIRIETVKPNRLKITLDFHKPFLSDKAKNIGDLQVKWLHGAIAGNLKTDIELYLTPAKTAFKQFSDYRFDDPSKEFFSEPKMIFEGKVDASGKAKIDPKIKVQKNAPGMLKARFKIRAFERGGEFSVDRTSVLYSPYRGYVGIKVPKGKGWNGALYSNETNLIPIVTVDEQGRPVDRKGLKIEIYDVYWRWWWERSDEDNLSRYVANRKKNLIKTATIDTKNGKAMYALNFKKNLYGRKFIRVIDPKTGHSSGQAFYVTYKGWWDNDDGKTPGAAEMLTFSTDKKIYQIGEKIKVNIPAANQGRILASVESGSKVIDAFWVDLNKDHKSINITATPEMSPNVYINLTLIQPHSKTTNDRPIRLYGVQSVRIENKNSHLEPVIRMPETLKPEQKFKVRVSEKNGKKMTYTLAVVDEGLLDLTRFKTPDPWSYFNAKEALSVHTWDMYKYVIGAFSGKLSGLLALGGDEYIKNPDGNKANRFKPVVRFIGPFTIEKNSSRTHTVDMPNYIGSVRTMVIAGDQTAYGSAEKATPVKKPLMLLATLPRVVSPGEQVSLPVTVFAMDKKIKNVKISVQPNEFLSLTGTHSKNIQFKKEGDQVVNFDLDVIKKLGVAKVKITAESGSEKASYEIELDVRAPNPKIAEVKSDLLEPGKTWENTYNAIGISGTNKGVVEVSATPPLKLEERLGYLISYPHGCIEQTTSSVFPQLYLSNLLDLKSNKKQEIEKNIKAGIDKLRTFQLPSGGLSYWNGDPTASDWGTSYAGHFMLEVQKKGYSLPPGFLVQWKRFQRQRANAWTPDMDNHNSYQSNQLIQAYRLYTLALAKSPVMGAMNRMRSMNNLSLAARWRLAAAYYLTGKKNAAQKLVANRSTDITPYTEMSYSFGSDVRDKAMILETLSLLGKKEEGKAVFDEIANDMASDNWYSTQTTAYSLLAVSKFIGTIGGNNKNLKISYNLNNSENSTDQKEPVYLIDLRLNQKPSGKISVKNKGKSMLFIKQQLEGIPTTGEITDSEKNLKMKVRYTTLDGKTISPNSLIQGTDFIAEVTLSHPGIRQDYKEMSLTQIFPSGWEIRNMRMDQNDNSKNQDKLRYQDIRDDRVLTYFDLKRGKTKTFRILLNAAYLGKFYLPVIYCQAMYDNSVNARKAGRWVKVIESGKK